MKKTYSSNLSCSSCVEKVSAVLDNEASVVSYHIDMESERKVINIESLKEQNTILEKLKAIGYYLNPDSGATSSKKQFWSDGNIWKRASYNTLNCLIGCSIGDFGMIVFLQAYYPETSMFWQMILAIIAGLTTSILLETFILKSREGFHWKVAFTTALSMSFISMIGMEIAMNLTDFWLTGGKASFTSMFYWFALIPSMIAGFLLPLPYNYYKLKKHGIACH